MKLYPFLFLCIAGAITLPPSFATAQPITMQQPINMIAYEHKAQHHYESVSYMPYYPAYGMISLKSPDCNAEIAGYIDPFALKHKKLIITYKTCKVSFNIAQNDQEISNSIETTSCEEYHPKNCSFSQIPALQRIPLGKHP
ncbi:hypothetical protein [Commensalibacter papalotli (ex Botero et al. 2024)]|uniref:Uncharacterized protein n=1 Tax=Commensalibacter papalotli (ex Botero et al. 2024) TaxID=2972766 RepID=A0ABM9HPE1_9PROT|nr:hypothetical protein [Commensalibacter papalotli (ex Botero et al. 2024)]CAI3934192.1 unnamed protein product [Commensalibacter papalotli (ex Botero et al. 2024)]CAI3941516.1 unnamed protein product [Commensalibacter papalotli (ex Botero et al. 2024)]